MHCSCSNNIIVLQVTLIGPTHPKFKFYSYTNYIKTQNTNVVGHASCIKGENPANIAGETMFNLVLTI